MSATVQYRREGNTQHWSVCAKVQDRCGIATSLGCRWLLSHMKNFQTVLEVSETNKPTSLHNENTKQEGIPAIAAGWLHSQLTSFQTVSVVPQTNKQQSMHDADTLSIHVHIISPAHRDQCCQQVSLRYHLFRITGPPHTLQNVDHSLPLSGSPGMASKIVSQVFRALVT